MRTDGPSAEAEFRAAGELRSRGLFDSSIVRFRTAAALFRMQRQGPSCIRSLNGVADNLIRKARFAEAESLLVGIPRGSFDLSEKDSLAFQETFYLLAYLANYNDRFDDALSLVDRSLQLQRRFSSSSGQVAANSLYLRGIILWRKGEFAPALSSLSRAHDIQTADGNAVVADRALTMMTIGAVEDATGKYTDAMRWYADAMRLLDAHQQGESAFAANCHHYMAVSSRSLGDFDAAIRHERRALAISEKVYGHQHLAVSAVLAQLGDIYTLSGDIVPAREHYGEALAIMTRMLDPGHSSVAEMERKLARLALETNQLDSARALMTRAASSKLKSLGPNHPSMGDIYEDMGDVSRARQEFREATDYYQRALAIKRSIGPSAPYLDLATLFRKIADIDLESGRLEEATEALGKAALFQDSSHSHNSLLAGAILRSLGDVQRKRGSIDEGLNSYSRALEELARDAQGVSASKRAGIFTARGELLKERSRLAGGRVDDLKAAAACYDSAAALLVQLRQGYQSAESKLSLQEEVLPVFHAGLTLCARIYQRTGEKDFLGAAFRFAELSKAAVLTETMRDAKAKTAGGIPDSLLERERRLSEIIAAAETKLLRYSHAGDSTTIAALRHRLFSVRREWNLLQESLVAGFPVYRKLRLQDEASSLESIRTALPSGTTLLRYALADDLLYLFTVSARGSDLYCLGQAGTIEEAARRLRSAIKKADPAGYVQHARFLHRNLISPAAKDLAGSNRLVVVPDGVLQSVPFGALLPDSGKRYAATARIDFTRLPYLITRYEVTYSLSGTLYLDALAGDLYSVSTEPTFAGFAPVFSDSSEPPALAQNLRGNERSVTFDGKTFGQLRFSEEEVRSIAAAFGDAGLPVAGFFRQDATKERFLATSSDYSILHIATHGVINEQSPALSGILFSPPGSRAASGEDILYAGETYGLHLRASLVVLGVCESGLGKYVKGEGVMALTRGFTCAGARNIAYSLWKVYDRHASALMRKFYAHVLQGERYSAALRKAEMEMIADKSTAFPLAWAGFVLSGE